MSNNFSNLGPEFNHAAARPEVNMAKDFEAARGGNPPEPEKYDEPHHRFDPPEFAPDGSTSSSTRLDDTIYLELSPQQQASVKEHLEKEAAFAKPKDHVQELDFNEPSSKDVNEYLDYLNAQDQHDNDNTPEAADEFDRQMMEKLARQHEQNHDRDRDA